MGKTYVGIDFGASDMKLAVVADGNVRDIATFEVPENLVRDGRIVSPELCAEFLKSSLKEAKIGAKACAVLLPASVAFTRTMTVPAMSHENLVINLPYEFRDFITLEKDKYFYDYALLDTIRNEEDEIKEYEIIAATTLKSTISDYGAICHRSGAKLKTAIPEELAYMNIIRQYEQRNGMSEDNNEYGFVDLGHTVTKLHIYKGCKHQATRVIEYGVGLLDSIIAEQLSVDEHLARAYKHANNNNEQLGELCINLYNTISLELMRALNFYRFNMPDSNLTDIYVCGGGSKIAPLIESVRDELGLSIRSVTELLPDSVKNMDDAALCHLAIGVAMQ